MYKKIKCLGLLLCLAGSSLLTQAQIRKEIIANADFDQYAYADAIAIYEGLIAKGRANEVVYKNLADAYYFNGKLSDANSWYTALFTDEYDGKDLGALPAEYYYRFSQTLKAVGDEEQSVKMLETFMQLAPEDSRVQKHANYALHRAEIEKIQSPYVLHNLNVNTSFSDYGGVLVNDQLVFTSARENSNDKKIHTWTSEPYTTLFHSDVVEGDTFGEPTGFHKNIQSRVNDASAVFTQDGMTMFFTRNNVRKNGRKKKNDDRETLLKIYKAKKGTDGQWGKAMELSINSDDFNTAHPALSADEKWLYFASDRVGGYGLSDVYRVEFLEGEALGEPINLGEGINTAGRETFPFISQDNQLYFSSDAHPGLGGLDVFSVSLEDYAVKGEIRNLGRPINSSLDDFAFYWNKSAQKGFVSSNRQGGQGGDDIYQISLAPCEQVLEGIVYEIESKDVLANATLEIVDQVSGTVEVLKTDAMGYYKRSTFTCNQQFLVKATHEDYNAVELTFNSGVVAGTKTLNIGLSRFEEPLKVNDDLFKRLNMEMIYFDFDKSAIRADAAVELQKILVVMQQYPTMKIDVRSHTDSRGNDAYNMALSDRRVKSTIAWLIAQGVSAERLTGKGYGESELVNNCANNVPCSIEDHQANRRSEFIILSL